jgi:cytochrome c biogenesis protein CcmG/thiol:disulfide interchange protein DsbE
MIGKLPEAHTMISPARRIRAVLLVPIACLLCLVAAGAALAQVSEDPVDELMKEGSADFGARKYDDALKAFKKANQLQHGSCAECYFQVAITENKTGDFDHAIKDCDKALACASTDAFRLKTHYVKANILQNSEPDAQKLKESEAEYRAVLAISPKFPEAHLNLGVVLLLESREADGLAELDEYLKAKPDGPDAPYARKLIERPKKAGRMLAPNFEVKTLNGDTLALGQLSGKVVVMDFWATWCPPCRESVPELKALTRKYSSDKLVLISFSADHDQQAWQGFVAQKKMDWPQYLDHDGRIRNQFGVNAFPTYLVIDPDGFVYKRIVGLNPQMSIVGQLKDTLKAILPE